jgi:hypothetical protein
VVTGLSYAFTSSHDSGQGLRLEGLAAGAVMDVGVFCYSGWFVPGFLLPAIGLCWYCLSLSAYLARTSHVRQHIHPFPVLSRNEIAVPLISL